MLRVTSISRQESRRRANKFALFVVIDRVACGRKRGSRPVSHFDKSEALPIKHDQVNFAAAAVEVSRDGPQALLN